MPARPTPNFFSAPRRVTDCARPFASSSNFLAIVVLSFSHLLPVISLCPSTLQEAKNRLARLGGGSDSWCMSAEIAARTGDVRTIQQLIEHYPDEWLAIAVTAEADGRPGAGRL